MVAPSQERLRKHILSMSQSTDFDEACREWFLQFVYVTEDLDSCPCGQLIKEHCEIQNRLTLSVTFVGNVCIKRFMGMDESELFAGIKRISKNPAANMNVALICYADERGFLFDRELDFLMETRLSRYLTKKQLAWKEKINRRVLSQIVVRRISRGCGR